MFGRIASLWTVESLVLVWLKRLLLVVAVATVGLGIFAAIGTVGGGITTAGPALVCTPAQVGDLPIVVTERGNLESQSNVEVYCEVDDIDGDGVAGTQIVTIVPNGSSVKKGELLVELDSARHVERLDRQFLDTEQARAVQIQAQARHENQITQNQTTEADADLDVTLADLELKMFKDQEKGTHQLEVEAMQRLIEDLDNEILAAQASMELKRNEKIGIETLFKLGYAGKREVDQIRLDFLQAESTCAAKINKLKTQLATLTKKQTYEKDMELLQLDGKLETAKRKQVQVRRNNEALLAQAKAALDAADQSLKKEEERLERYREQITKCKIYAPQDGMVAYATSANRYYFEDIRQGAAVRPRQLILTLPNLSLMQVKTAVHESVLDQTKPGLPASIRVDAFPDRHYKGSVKSVAVLPDQGGYMSSDTKVYETIVTIDEDVLQLKPGMTAVVDIDVDRLTDVLTVPVQAIVQVDKETFCFVDMGVQPERRVVKLGRTNDKFVQIESGIKAGEQVVLNPMALVDEEAKPSKEKEAEGSAASPSDTAKPAPKPASPPSLPSNGTLPAEGKPAVSSPLASRAS